MKIVPHSHVGTLLSAAGGKAVVEIELDGNNDCASCSIADICNSGKSSRIRVDADIPAGMVAEKGARVRIAMRRNASLKASLLLLVLPLTVFLATVAALTSTGVAEASAALIAFAACGLCFAALYISRNRRPGSWTITEIIY